MDPYIEQIKKIGCSDWIKQNPKGKKLIKSLMKKYATAYYEGNALICDLDFDILVDTLKLIDPEDKYLTTPGWGYKIKKGVKHPYGKIGTLPYYYNHSQVTEIFSENEELIITPKFDGINYVSYFKKGKFSKCATRGNGTMGKNISWAFKEHINIPNNLQKESFAINGEVIFLDKPSKELNFRNIVATYLNKKNKINEKIIFMPFGLLNTNYKNNYFKQIEIMNLLSPNKIIYKKYKKLPSAIELKKLFKEFQKLYQIDGLVITNKDKSKQIAYKFKEELK